MLFLTSLLKSSTNDEAERRYRQIESLQSKQFQLERAYTNVSSDGNNSRSDLQQSNKSVGLWENDDDDDEDDELIARFDQTKPTSSKQLLRDQDEALESLSHIISRQKDIAIKINDEVDVQNG